MESRKLLIAEGSEEYCLALAEALNGAYHIRTCTDGRTAKELLRSFEPDVLILDLMLPELDGLGLLQSIHKEGRMPAVLTISCFYSGYVGAALQRLGIEYAMRKPCSISAVVERLRDMEGQSELPAVTRPDLRSAVTNIMLSLNFKTSHDGYMYLREAVLLVVRRQDRSITKELYPDVAAIFGCRGESVEHSSRTAIKWAWQRRDEKIWRIYFFPDSDGVMKCPSNGVFISRIAEALRMTQAGEEHEG